MTVNPPQRSAALRFATLLGVALTASFACRATGLPSGELPGDEAQAGAAAGEGASGAAGGAAGTDVGGPSPAGGTPAGGTPAGGASGGTPAGGASGGTPAGGAPGAGGAAAGGGTAAGGTPGAGGAAAGGGTPAGGTPGAGGAAAGGGTAAGGTPGAVHPPLSRARVFFIGHSLVNHEMPAMVAGLARAAGLDFDYQTQVINGAPLRWNWDHAAQGEGRYAMVGNARAELPSGRFDVVIMTEGIPLDDDTVRAGGNFYRIAVEANRATRAFMYETWHSLDWDPLYDAYNRGEPDHRLHIPGRNSYDWRAVIDSIRPAWERRIDGINQAVPGYTPMRMVPAGTVMGKLVDEIEGGRVPGMSSRRALFSDGIHLNHIGNYFVALVQFATIFRRSPEGLPERLEDQWGRAFTPPTRAQAEAFQRIVWQHVARDPRAGVRAD